MHTDSAPVHTELTPVHSDLTPVHTALVAVHTDSAPVHTDFAPVSLITLFDCGGLRWLTTLSPRRPSTTLKYTGGANHGDEDFAFFRCPHCRRVYLLEYEVDTVYLDPADLAGSGWEWAIRRE
jgi:hypothetical protein